MRRNPRYLWRGDRPHAEVRALLKRARAVVLSSLSEGGANVVSEAAAAGVPVLASRSTGQLACSAETIPATSRSDRQPLWRAFCGALRPIPNFSVVSAAPSGAGLIALVPRAKKNRWRKLLGEVLAPRPR